MQPAGHWFGVDLLGRDEFSRIIYGARFSLLIGVVSVSIGLSIGLLLGSIVGTTAAVLTWLSRIAQGTLLTGITIMVKMAQFEI